MHYYYIYPCFRIDFITNLIGTLIVVSTRSKYILSRTIDRRAG
jgi:hypothetical protein